MSGAKRILIITGCILFFACLCQYMLDPLAPFINRIKLNKLQKELNEVEKKWSLQNITSYSFEVEYYSFASLGGCGAIITVEDGNLVKIVETQRGGWKKLPRPRTLPETMWNDNYCDYSHFTIPGIFGIVQNGINMGGTVNASFDSEIGFVTEYYADANISYAPLRGSITDSGVSFKVSNFQRLDPSTP